MTDTNKEINDSIVLKNLGDSCIVNAYESMHVVVYSAQVFNVEFFYVIITAGSCYNFN